MHTHILSSKEIDSSVWDAFIYASPQGSPFVLFEYMNIIKEEWQAVIVEEKGIWQAVMPIAFSKKWRFSAILQPFFAQYWGICFAPSTKNARYKQYSQQKKYGMAIVEAIDHIDLFALNFSPEFDYPLPFHWKNYELKTKYTYQLSLKPSAEELFAQFAPPLRRQIVKAKRNDLRFVEHKSAEPLIQLIKHNEAEGKSVLGSAKSALEVLRNLATYTINSGGGNLYCIVDKNEQILATGLFLHFLDRTYYLQGAYLPEMNNSGAMSMLMWEAILKSKETEKIIFDFEGSMIMGIEAFFRKFGAEAVSYLHIYRNQLPTLIKWIQELQ